MGQKKDDRRKKQAFAALPGSLVIQEFTYDLQEQKNLHSELALII